jgi:thiamine biosynthesis lipoprotein
MATTFEIVIAGQEAGYAREASQAVFAEIDRLEKFLSRFDDGSDVAMINRLKPGESLRVGFDVYECLRAASNIHSETQGAFDITVGSLVPGKPEVKDKVYEDGDEINECIPRDSAMDRLELIPVYGPGDEDSNVPLQDGVPLGLRSGGETSAPCSFEVRYRQEGIDPGVDRVCVDLGGIGKGYALDQAVEILQDWGIENVLLHSGSSTAVVLGSAGIAVEGQPASQGWPLSIGGKWLSGSGSETVCIRNASISGSGSEVKGQHIIDPRTGQAASGHLAAWVSCPTAVVADALSTAFIIMNNDEVDKYSKAHPAVSTLLVRQTESRDQIYGFGDWRDKVVQGN